MKTIPRLIYALLLSTACTALTGKMAAAQPGNEPRTTISYRDLDLRRDADAATLRRRIDNAIVRLSGGDEPIVGTLLSRPDLEEARKRGKDQADALIRAVRRLCGPSTSTG